MNQDLLVAMRSWRETAEALTNWRPVASTVATRISPAVTARSRAQRRGKGRA